MGLKHVDLWCDGHLYPLDPRRFSHPPFSTPTSLLRFVGDGTDGLLGYCRALSTEAVAQRSQLQMQYAEIRRLLGVQKTHEGTIEELHNQNDGLQKQLHTMRQKETALGVRLRKRKLKNMENLKPGSGGLKKRIQAIRFAITYTNNYYYLIEHMNIDAHSFCMASAGL